MIANVSLDLTFQVSVHARKKAALLPLASGGVKRSARVPNSLWRNNTKCKRDDF